MKNIYHGITSILLLLVVLSAWYVSGILSGRAASSGAWDIVPAVVLLLATGFIIYLINENMISGGSSLAPVIWFILATANPAALTLSPILAATPLVAASIALLLAFCTVRPSIEYIAACFALLGVAAMLLPPLIWLSPIFFICSITRTESKARTVVASLLALAIPLFTWCCIRFLAGDLQAVVATLEGFGRGAVSLNLIGTGASAPTIARLALTVVLTLISLILVIRRLDSYTTDQFRSANRIIILLPSLVALAILFLGGQPWELLTAIPASLLIDEYASRPVHRRGCTLILTALGLLLLAERIYLYL